MDEISEDIEDALVVLRTIRDGLPEKYGPDKIRTIANAACDKVDVFLSQHIEWKKTLFEEITEFKNINEVLYYLREGGKIDLKDADYNPHRIGKSGIVLYDCMDEIVRIDVLNDWGPKNIFPAGTQK